MKIKRLGAVGSAFILSVSTAFTVAFPQIAHAAGNTLYWCGANNANFSTASNWNTASNCGAGTVAAAPPGSQAGGDGSTSDTLIFDLSNNASGGTLIANDDIASNLDVASIEFTGGSGTVNDAYAISGNTITPSSGVSDNSLSSSGTFNQFDNLLNIVATNTSFAISTGSTTMFESLQGSGNIAVTGGGTAEFATTGSGSSLASYLGTISSSDGSMVQLQNDLSGTYSSSGSVAVSGTSVLDLAGGSCKTSCTYTYNLPISLGGSGTGKDCALNLDGFQDTNITNDFTGAVTLTSNICITSVGNTTVDFDGPVNFGTFTIKSPVNPPVVTINVAAGTNDSSINPNVGQNVTYINDGTVGDATVLNGGLLKGNGTYNSANVQAGGTIAPGHSPGCITLTGNLTLNGTLTEDIQSPGATACTDFSQVIVGGTVDLTGGALDTQFLSGFAPAVGQSYEIIQNKGGSPVTGTFSGLPEGSVFAAGNIKLQITYKGAGGNNVVLTVVNPSTPVTAVPGAPNTGFGLTSAKYMLPLIGSLFIAAGLYAISRKANFSIKRS